MIVTTKDFDPIRDAYAFFEEYSTEAEGDINGYLPHLAAIRRATSAVRLLDFGCGPGTFSAKFLSKASFGEDRLQLTLVEPVEKYRRQTAVRLEKFTNHPVNAWRTLTTTGACFDLILCNHVLYYVSDLGKTLGDLLNTLVPGGLFLTSIAGHANVLIQFWKQGFAFINEPVPHHTAEDVEESLERMGWSYRKQITPYELAFSDSEENRLMILRFLMGNHLVKLPRKPLLDLFEPYAREGRIVINTFSEQFVIEKPTG